MTQANVKLQKIGKSDMGKTYAVFADSVPVAMITAWADGHTDVNVQLGPDTLEFLKRFAPAQTL